MSYNFWEINNYEKCRECYTAVIPNREPKKVGKHCDEQGKGLMSQSVEIFNPYRHFNQITS